MRYDMIKLEITINPNPPIGGFLERTSMIKLEMILYSTEAWEKYVAHTQSKMLVKADLRPHDHDIDEVLIDAINQAINNNVNEIHVIKSEHDNFDDVMTLIKELASNIKGYSIELT